MPSLVRAPKLFGSSRRTEVLILLALLGESYPAELIRLLAATKASVLQILDGLELEGVVASRPLGRTRRIALDRARVLHRRILPPRPKRRQQQDHHPHPR